MPSCECHVLYFPLLSSSSSQLLIIEVDELVVVVQSVILFCLIITTAFYSLQSFSRIQKDQVTSWQKEMVDRLGPAPPPPRRSSYHHHRATSRRFSYQYSSHQAAVERGGSHSVPYTPRSSVGCGGSCSYVPSRPYFTAPVRMSYLQPQSQQQTPHSTFLQAPSPFGVGTRWNVGIGRVRSTEPDVYHQGLPLRATFREQQTVASSVASSGIAATHCGQQQHQRVASMDSLTVVSTPYGHLHPYAVCGYLLLPSFNHYGIDLVSSLFA